jgi:hypothetical protein
MDKPRNGDLDRVIGDTNRNGYRSDMSMQLQLTTESAKNLRELLEGALRLEPDAYVVPFLPADPWGDLVEFRHSIYDPLRTATPAPSGASASVDVEVPDEDRTLLFDVLDALGHRSLTRRYGPPRR